MAILELSSFNSLIARADSLGLWKNDLVSIDLAFAILSIISILQFPQLDNPIISCEELRAN